MKNIITVITIILFFTSCDNDKKSAKNDIGDISEYVAHQEEKKETLIKEKTENNALTTENNTVPTQESVSIIENIVPSEETIVSVENIISEGGPTIEFSNVVWDFGNIKQGEIVDHVFQFINTGSEPLIISNAKGSCGCTVPEWPKEPIPPNGVGEIAVQFKSENKKGKQNKTVTLTTNCTPNTTILRVVGNILID